MESIEFNSENGEKRPRRKLSAGQITGITTIAVVLLCIIAFFIFTGITYKADESAISEFYQKDGVSFNVENDGKNIVVKPLSTYDTMIVFYPGARVEIESYLPLMGKLAEKGYMCVVVKMPLNMAFFGVNKANDIISKYNVENVYMMGHSLGGVMASKYCAKHSDNVNGLILLGSYIYGDYSDEDTLTIYGEYNSDVKDKITYEKNIHIIAGGNHANFGNYGKQRGDEDATITNDEQQNETVNLIDSFVRVRASA